MKEVELVSITSRIYNFTKDISEEIFNMDKEEKEEGNIDDPELGSFMRPMLKVIMQCIAIKNDTSISPQDRISTADYNLILFIIDYYFDYVSKQKDLAEFMVHDLAEYDTILEHTSKFRKMVVENN